MTADPPAAADETIKIAVVYAKPSRQVWLDLEVPKGATVRQAIERSGILHQCPDINLDHATVGIHAKIVTLDTTVEDGARVEIYRPITADPDTIERRR